MGDTEFAFNDSLLFGNTETVPGSVPESIGTVPESEDTGLVFSQSLLFSNSSPPPLGGSSKQMEDRNSDTYQAAKTVKLFDGSTLLIRPRHKKATTVEFSEDPDGILNMEKLYERVHQRELRKANQKCYPSKPQNDHTAAQKLLMLWLEKYTPKSFMQLCPAANEREYRLIMQWIRKWRAVVFGGEKDGREFVDYLGRPQRKILLVHGPPGIGKTVAVHLLAKQAGYNIEELNASNSMDSLQGAETLQGSGRFANATAALKFKVKNALTTNSITSDGKPSCLVVDEIDSSVNTGDIVKVLTDLVRTDQANTRKRDGQELKKDSRKKSNKKPFVLSRPIICIANDIYNTSARSGGPNPMEALRPFCEVIAFRKATSNSNDGARFNASAHKSVKEFLSGINELENLKLDRKEIAEVFEICDGDIRACINYLQFSSRKLHSDISLPDHGEGIANKDSLIPWFTLVDRIFKRNQHVSKEEDFETMLELVSSGDGKSAAGASLDKIIRGCFNKYLDVVHLQDDSAVRPAEISDWLFYYDLLTTQNLNTQFYPALTSLKFWSLFSDINSQKFRNINGLIPDIRNLDYNSREALKRNKSIVGKLANLVPLELKVSLCGMSSESSFFASEFIPILDKMLTPEIGSAKTKILLKSHEANVVEKLADLIKRLDISLESQRDVETNQIYLVYGPDWEGLTIFHSGDQNVEQKKKALNIKRQWLFPLLQSELDSLMSTGMLKRQRAEFVKESKESNQKRIKMTSSLEFFKGQYDDMLSKIATIAKPVNREATRIWVKHHEGFSNAVRKNIGWNELWSQ